MKRQVMSIFIALELLCVLFACDSNQVAENYPVNQLKDLPEGFVQPINPDEATLQRLNDLQSDNPTAEFYYLQTSVKDMSELSGKLWQHKLKIESFEESQDQMGLFVKKVDHIEKEIFQVVENQPEPVEGMSAFFSHIQQNLTYPAQAKEQGIEGKVFIEFVVAKDGSLEDVKAIKGIGAGCDEEALRVIKSAPAWTAGSIDGKPVKVKMVLPITFKLSGDGEAKQSAAEVMPEPKDGLATFLKYIEDNIKYPASAKDAGVEGKVFVEFTVKKDGSMADIMVKKGVTQALDAEALRVMQNSPAWKPGRKDGEPVNMKMVLPISFKLS